MVLYVSDTERARIAERQLEREREHVDKLTSTLEAILRAATWTGVRSGDDETKALAEIYSLARNALEREVP